MGNHVEHEPQCEGNNDEEVIPENELVCGSGNERLAHDDTSRLIQETFTEYEEDRIRRLINDRRK